MLKKLLMAMLLLSENFAHGGELNDEVLVDDFKVLKGQLYDTTLLGQDAAVEIGVFQEHNPELQLRNGGMVATKKSFKSGNGVSVQFAYEAEPKRAEVFTLAFRTDGSLTNDGELKNGSGVRIRAQDGVIELVQFEAGKAKVLTEKAIPKSPDGIGFPRGGGINWYVIQLADTGNGMRASVAPIGDPNVAITLEAAYPKSDEKQAAKKGKDTKKVLPPNHVVLWNNKGAADEHGSNSVFARHLLVAPMNKLASK